jgi:aromatic ring hydroxylase
MMDGSLIGTEKNGDITTHPKFRIPLEIAAEDYDQD